MALFWKKKEKEKKKAEELPEPPPFPEMREIKEAVKPAPVIPPVSTVPEPISTPPLARGPTIKISRLPEEKERLIPSVMAPAAIPAAPTRPTVVRAAKEEREAAKLREEPIFVKIDRFESALSAFEEIKRRLKESFELLEKIKRTRSKEKEEIDAWEREINEIKENLDALDKKLFGRIGV